METGGSGPCHPTLALRIRGKLNVLWGWEKDQAKEAKQSERESSGEPRDPGRNLPG